METFRVASAEIPIAMSLNLPILGPVQDGGASFFGSLGNLITDGVVDSLALTQDGLESGLRSFEVSWDPRSVELNRPILRVETNFRLDLERGNLGRFLFRQVEASVGYAHLIEPKICGVAPGDPPCEDGVTLFQGYRTLSFADGADAVAPAMGLDFDVCTEPHVVEAEVRAGLRCPINLRFMLALLPPVFVDVIQGIGFPGFACRRLANAMEGIVEDSLCGGAGAFEQLVATAINPPSFRLTLGQALFALGADASGDGVLSSAEINAAIEELTDGEISGAGIALMGEPLDLIFVNPTAIADVDAAGGFPAQEAVRVLGSDAALTDGAIVALTRGGELSVDAATVDFRELRSACAADRVTGSALICELCAAGMVPSLCEDGELVDGITIVAGTDPLLGPIDVQPSPNVATFLSSSVLFAETLRRVFDRPLPANARYVASAADSEPGEDVVARFIYVVDPDQDLIDSSVDNCPLTPNASQTESDGDDFGDACDTCPGVFNERSRGETEVAEFGDFDGDGRPNGCDCDSDADGCTEPGFEITEAGIVECTLGVGETFDDADRRLLGDVPSGDLDGDGIPNQCDADIDDDGVDNTTDNCPIGDGDATFEPGIDDDPDQTNSGGSPLGDVCDPLCRSAGDVGCGPPGGGGPAGDGDPPADSGLYFDGAPGARDCVGTLCRVGALVDCFGAEVDVCFDLGANLLLVGQFGFPEAVLNAQALGLESAFSGRVAELLSDLDGDGLGELVVSSPTALSCQGCSPNEPDCVCEEEGGRVQLIGSRGGILADIGGPLAGGRFGESFVTAGDVLFVGSPGFGAGGAVFVYDVGAGTPILIQQVDGNVGDELGTDLTVSNSAWPPRVFAGAPGAGYDRGAFVEIDALRGEVDRLSSHLPNARVSAATVLRDRHDRQVVVAGAPSAFHGRGALLFFHRGRLRRVVRGQHGERLGAAIAADADAIGAHRIAVGAPGRNDGSGAVHLYSLNGRRLRTFVYWGDAVGAALSTPGDINGDGRGELWVGMDVNGSAATVAWTL